MSLSTVYKIKAKAENSPRKMCLIGAREEEEGPEEEGPAGGFCQSQCRKPAEAPGVLTQVLTPSGARSAFLLHNQVQSRTGAEKTPVGGAGGGGFWSSWTCAHEMVGF